MTRQSDTGLHPIFLERWSPRSFDGAPVPKADLEAMLDAARWAPSAFNLQPWRFVTVNRDSPRWAEAVATLAPFNAAWAEHAGALVFLLSDTLIDKDDGPVASPTHGFDAGAAWAQLALQATMSGYHAHGMGGFDRDQARSLLNVPERFAMQIAIAIGRRGAADMLPEALRDREQPSPRRPLAETAFVDRFPVERDVAQAA
jgi:nitroreductase